MKEDKTNLPIILLSALLIAVVLGAIVFAIAKGKNKTPNNKPTVTDSNLIFYYSNSCPHCKNVEKYFDENGIRTKVAFIEKEVSTSQKNANELYDRAKTCNIAPEKVGVPLLWDDGKCVTGDDPIIEYFKEKTK